MDFKERYHSEGASIYSFAENKDIERIEVHVSTNGMRNRKIEGKVYHVTVLPEEYEEVFKKATEINMKKQKERDERRVALNNELSPETIEALKYFDALEPYDESKKKKREVKNKPKTLKGKLKNFGRKVKEIASTKIGKAVITIGSIVMSALLVAGAYTNAQEWMENYKAEAASNVLTTVKQELGADAIYDRSTITGSNTALIWYEVEKDGKTYTYKASIDDGDVYVIQNDGLDQQTRGAITIAAEAQNGKFGDAKRANGLVEDIKNGDVNLVVDTRDDGR